MQAHERGQSECRRRGCLQMLNEEQGQMQCLLAQLDSDRRFSRGAVIPLVEEQVQGAMDRGQARREISVGKVKEPPGRAEHLLCPLDPLLRRRPAR
jgi:hypothetical protein